MTDEDYRKIDEINHYINSLQEKIDIALAKKQKLLTKIEKEKSHDSD